MRSWKGIFPAVIVFAAIFVFGCSSGSDQPVTPLQDGRSDASSGEAHQLLGYWQFTADPVAGTLDITEMRDTAMHLNALVFLEPPVLLNLTLESLHFNGNIIEAGIGLRHPFVGLTEFSGFDVCGILISNGSVGGFSDPDILMPGQNDLHLMNPDGYTRWWDPSEFAPNGMFGYSDGMLGTPDNTGNFTATINGYKYFSDVLTENSPLSDQDPTSRGLFSAGQKNIRHFSIDMGTSGLVFNYAVDANWTFPTGNAPWTAPDDFPLQANRPEAWNISIGEVENTLWNDGIGNGGDLKLKIDVYDWYNADQNTVTVESPGNFPLASAGLPTGGGVGYSTYEIEILDASPVADAIDLFITVQSEVTGYGALLPGEQQAVYFTSTANVAPDAPQPPSEDIPEWAGFQYNSANVGRNSFDQGFDYTNYTQKWYAPLPGFFKPCGPVVLQDYCYVNVCDTFYSSSSNHFVYCLNMNDGSTVWSHNLNPTGDYARAMASPIWFDDGSDGRIVIGGDRIWCLDALTGAIEWEYGESYSCVMTNMKYYKGNIYVPLGGQMNCIDAMTGSAVWVSDPGLAAGECVPAVANDKVYFAAGTTFTCLDANTGDILWQTPGVQGQSHWDAPMVYNGRVYMASYYQWLGCLDANDGTLYWVLNPPGASAWITALTYWIDPSDNKVVIYLGGAFSGPCQAVKDMGSTYSQIWQSPAIYFDASPIYNDGIIYVGDTSGTFFGYDAATGSQVFTQPIGGGTRGAAGIAFGRMVVPAVNGIYCFE